MTSGDPPSEGHLWGIGVGPGDPDLLTLKGWKLLQRVPVVAYPAPPSGEALARRIAAPHLPAGVREVPLRLPIGPDLDAAEAAYDAAAQRLAVELAAGHEVAVLCEGDPLLYGSFQYLLGRLAARWRITVVPGVSSVLACAAAAGVPLVGRSESLIVLPALLDDATLERALATADAAALVKVGPRLGRVRRVLARIGRLEHAVFVAHASRVEQEVLPLAATTAEAAPYFSMILVGGACAAGARP